jgi:hypothetical protein
MIVEEFEGIVQHGSVEDGQERLGGLCARAVDAKHAKLIMLHHTTLVSGPMLWRKEDKCK